MIERERKRVEETGNPAPIEDRGLTPAQESKKVTQERIDRMLPIPELKPLNPQPIRNLKINGQPVKVLYETLGKVAGVNVLWDPEYQPPTKNSFNLDFENATLEEALNYVGIITKSYWKPLSANTIFVTNDNPNKRRDFEEMVAQTFYLTNVSSPQEIQEIVNAVRSIADLQRVVAFTSQNAIIVRGEADKVALAAKMIHDLDKPRSEVVVDIMVMEASSSFSEPAHRGHRLHRPESAREFNPRQSIQVQSLDFVHHQQQHDQQHHHQQHHHQRFRHRQQHHRQLDSAQPTWAISSSADFATTLPSALLQAAMSDAKTKVLQAPQLRSVDDVKATLKIGEREPTASGSFQPGIVRQRQPAGEHAVQLHRRGRERGPCAACPRQRRISMHIDLDISNVAGTVNLGGLSQPIIGQRKVHPHVRMQEGEVSLLGGLSQTSTPSR